MPLPGRRSPATVLALLLLSVLAAPVVPAAVPAEATSAAGAVDDVIADHDGRTYRCPGVAPLFPCEIQVPGSDALRVDIHPAPGFVGEVTVHLEQESSSAHVLTCTFGPTSGLGSIVEEAPSCGTLVTWVDHDAPIRVTAPAPDAAGLYSVVLEAR